MNLKAAHLFAGGIETSYYYYPEQLKNSNHTFSVYFGKYLAINLSKSNALLDIGISANTLKTFIINEKINFNFGTSLSVLRKTAADLKKYNLDFGTNVL